MGLLSGLLTSHPGRAQNAPVSYVQLTDGTRLKGKIKLKNPERLVFRPETGPAVDYTPAQVSYFVVGRDSFVVVEDMDVFLSEQVQHYERGFARVLLNRAGYEAYQVSGQAEVERTQLVGPVGKGMPLTTTGPERFGVIIFRSPRTRGWVTLPRNQRELSNIALQYVAADPSLADAARSPAFTPQQFPLLIADWLRATGQ